MRSQPTLIGVLAVASARASFFFKEVGPRWRLACGRCTPTRATRGKASSA
jgi:hypothetical protein